LRLSSDAAEIAGVERKHDERAEAQGEIENVGHCYDSETGFVAENEHSEVKSRLGMIETDIKKT
jgi:hypothetical protein